MTAQRTSPNTSAIGIGVIILMVVMFLIGMRVGASQAAYQTIGDDGVTNTEIPEGISANFGDFWEVWGLLKGHYPFEQPENQEKVYNAIRGLTASYKDPYTMFFSPEEARIFEQDIQGEFGGIGSEIEMIDGILTVVSPLKGSPAERADLRPKDIIVKIDGEDSEGLSIQEALQKIRGKEGKAVTLTIYRDGASGLFDITIVREIIKIPIVIEKKLEGGIYEIQLTSFSTESASLFKSALKNALKTNPKGIIIDVRGNPGGLLSSAIDIASHFLPKDEIIVKEDFGGKKDNIAHTSYGYGTVPESIPVVMLVDGGSASASEILAGALKENGRVRLVGTQTFGKGSVQELLPIGKDAAVKITIAQWLTPDDHQISKKGIEPDYVIERSEEEIKKKTVDSQLDKAIQLILKK